MESNSTTQRINHHLTWSFAGPWYWEFQQLGEVPGDLIGKINFLAKYGFDCMPLSFSTLDEMSNFQRDEFYNLTKNLGITFHPHAHLDFLTATTDEVKASAEKWLAGLEKHRKFFGTKITTTGAGAGHRFDRKMPLEDKLTRLSKTMAITADACARAGFPLAVENHGDYYCSDFATLCEMTPNLHIFLDTGNTYLIGERPIEAFEAAAPYTIGTHFKDHFVKPNPNDLRFEIDGAALGSGDVELAKCYDILMNKSPNPRKLIMEIEMVAPNGTDPIVCLEDSIKFINSLK